MKFGSEIGNRIWRNELPVIEGDGAIEGDELNEHFEEVLEAISNYSPQKYAKKNGTQNGDRGNGLA